MAFHSASSPDLSRLDRGHGSSTGDDDDAATAVQPDRPVAAALDLSAEDVTSSSASTSIQEFGLDLSLGTSEDEGSADEDGHVANLPARPLSSKQFSRSHTYLAPSAFAPPFYNRPPTPLPPSPSLTSLLRPNFSSQNSRPTTPDPSSDEGGASHIRGDATGSQTPNSAAASTLTSTLRSAKPIPRASPKVPTYEYYGFTLYLTSSLAFIIYLFWAFLPSPFLHQLGIYYYPDRWWALAIPAWTVMFIVYIYVALASYNREYLTLPLRSVECMVDEAANVAVVDATGTIIRNDRPSWRAPSPTRTKPAKAAADGVAKGRHSRRASPNTPQLARHMDWRSLWAEGTDAVMDIPLGGVCEILYGTKSDLDDTQDSHENDY